MSEKDRGIRLLNSSRSDEVFAANRREDHFWGKGNRVATEGNKIEKGGGSDYVGKGEKK